MQKKINQKLKVAFVSEWGDLRNPDLRSGVPFFITKFLEEHNVEVIPVLAESIQRPIFEKLLTRGLMLFFNSFLQGRFGIYYPDRSPSFLKSYARQVEKRLEEIKYDFILCPGTLPIAKLNTDKPIILWVDATFANLNKYYPSMMNISNLGIKEGHKAERLALEKAALAVYTSDWARNSAINDYGADSEKVIVIPRGANLMNVPSYEEVEIYIQNRSIANCKILFIGGDWERKGGDLVIDVCDELIKQKFPVELHIAGLNPGLVPNRSYITQYGRLKKSDPAQRQIFEKLLMESHFLFMPSRSEAFGIVYAEASAFGLPSIAINTGGVSSVIENEMNGMLFEKDSSIVDYASYIKSVFSDRTTYMKLCECSYELFKKRFLWKENVGLLLKELKTRKIVKN